MNELISVHRFKKIIKKVLLKKYYYKSNSINKIVI